MNRFNVLLGIVLLVSSADLVRGQGEAPDVTLDYTFASKYIWHGFNLYGHNTNASQPSVNVDFWDTGFGAMVFHSRAKSSGQVNAEEYNYILYYSNSFLDDTPLATDYSVSWLYYDYYRNNSHDSDVQELVLSFAWPNLLPGGITPNYTTGKLWQSSSNEPALKGVSGWVHVFGLNYGLTTPGILGGSDEQVIDLIADLTYNDGYNGANVDHDWSHVTLGASTSFDLGHNLTLTPGVYYQISMDDSVNDKDEVWTTLSLSYQF